MKISVNNPCPCGSLTKYKLCCQKYHKGAKAKDALTLMKSRYSAYVHGDAKYIIKTTHPENPEFQEDTKVWQKSIENFCSENSFLGLEILSYEVQDEYSYVVFIASFGDRQLYEKSRFVLNGDTWLYIDGEIKY
ncbi:MAG TPA: zinc chelation protein SecC [Campylobacterales bacterium]|nr:zinc chelation protein SecC [Campylobacterales bacterium]